jgi:hypothetical protein
MLIFDIEADGLLPTVSEIHCIVIYDTVSQETWRYRSFGIDSPIRLGLEVLMDSDEIAGHNILGYDIPAIQKLYPWWHPTGSVFDTLNACRIVWPHIKDLDFHFAEKTPEFPKQLIGRHSLEAWGWRLGDYKGDFKGPWTQWSQEMEDYCVQDVRVTTKLYDKIQSKGFAPECFELATRVQQIINRQQDNGFHFDEAAAEALVARLSRRRAEVEVSLRGYFGAFYLPDGARTMVPKRDNKKQGYAEGAPLSKVKLVEFNPCSGDHIAHRLTKLYGWVPKEFTPEGKPKTDESVLEKLPYEPAKLLVEHALLTKRLGQIAEGKEAWLKASKNGVIHGQVIIDGTVTGRMAHQRPNMAQVPAGYSPYGKECRALFKPRPGWKLVGCDADGLELRCLGHRMAKWDNGEFARAVVLGRKEDGTDAHTINQRAVGLNSRDSAKTFIYALIYGAGDLKLGSVIVEDMTKDQRKELGKVTDRKLMTLGKAGRAKLMRRLPALDQFVEAVKAAARRGWLRGLDGRKLHIRAEHAAPNTLLQSDGAVLMKRALVLLDESLKGDGLVPGVDYEYVVNVHDEIQTECRPELAEKIGKAAAQAITDAGNFYGYRCPLAGSYSIGDSWADTH